MDNALVSGWKVLGSSPGWRNYVLFLGKTLYFESASLHPGTGELNAGDNPAID